MSSVISNCPTILWGLYRNYMRRNKNGIIHKPNLRLSLIAMLEKSKRCLRFASKGKSGREVNQKFFAIIAMMFGAQHVLPYQILVRRLFSLKPQLASPDRTLTKVEL